jgi:predicted DNA-binding transcriptional regulator AlpA
MSAVDIAEAIRELARPWMTAEQAAIHLGYETRTFREKIAVRPGFPEPRYFGGVSPRWKRSELDEWADAQPRRRQPSRSATADMSGE